VLEERKPEEYYSRVIQLVIEKKKVSHQKQKYKKFGGLGKIINQSLGLY
jgi:hypothetical protein